MLFNYQIVEGVAMIRPPAQFNFHNHREFRETCKTVLANDTVKSLVIDFKDVDYIDSSVLGSLMFVKERLDQNDRAIRLINCRGMVKSIMEVASFHRLFDMG